MAFDWHHYLTLAKELAKKGTEEASLRSAVSRSYYCVFNLALMRATEREYRNNFDETGGSHDLLWQLYGRNSRDKSCTRLSLMGPRMKRRRIKADYRSVYEKLPDEVKDALDDAEECIALLRAMPNEFPVNEPRVFHF